LKSGCPILVLANDNQALAAEPGSRRKPPDHGGTGLGSIRRFFDHRSEPSGEQSKSQTEKPHGAFVAGLLGFGPFVPGNLLKGGKFPAVFRGIVILKASVGRRSSIPTGLDRSALGCSERATQGQRIIKVPNSERVASTPKPPHFHCVCPCFSRARVGYSTLAGLINSILQIPSVAPKAFA